MDSEQSQYEWEVERILDKREQDGKVQYRVLWKGFDVSEATWEPIEYLGNIQEMMRKFETERRKPLVAYQPRNKSFGKQLSYQKSTNLSTEESMEEPILKKRASNTRQIIGDCKGRKIVHKSEECWKQISQKQKERSEKSELIKQKLSNYLQEETRPNHQKQTIKKMKNACQKLDSQRQKWYEDEGLTQVSIKKVYFQQVNSENNQKPKNPAHFDIFFRQRRYKECDQMLRSQKQLILRNIIDRQAGLQVQKRKIKMLEVSQDGLLESTLKNIPTVDKISIISKLKMLIKSRFGWIAIGKDDKNRLFMADVNLLEQDCWKGILIQGAQT